MHDEVQVDLGKHIVRAEQSGQIIYHENLQHQRDAADNPDDDFHDNSDDFDFAHRAKTHEQTERQRKQQRKKENEAGISEPVQQINEYLTEIHNQMGREFRLPSRCLSNLAEHGIVRNQRVLQAVFFGDFQRGAVFDELLENRVDFVTQSVAFAEAYCILFVFGAEFVDYLEVGIIAPDLLCCWQAGNRLLQTAKHVC